jgi:6-phosphogluconolactonase
MRAAYTFSCACLYLNKTAMNIKTSDRNSRTAGVVNGAAFYQSLLLLISICLLLPGCDVTPSLNNDDNSFSADDLRQNDRRNPTKGFVYTMSNDASQNTILCFLQNSNGTLKLLTTVPTKGSGTSAGLGSQGALALDAANSLLFAVNAGDNTISSFKVDNDGRLTFADTVKSGGVLPVSLSMEGNLLYVVNSTSANISGFNVSSDGTMSHIPGSDQLLSDPAAGPAQISFKPGGGVLAVTEKMTNRITTFTVNSAGLASAAISVSSAGITPFGFDFSGSNYMIVSEASGGAADASTVTSYSLSAAGETGVAAGPVATTETAACWVATSRDGKYSFVTNTGSNNISSLLSSNGDLQIIEEAAAVTDAAPIDITFSGNEDYLYNINGTSHTITEFKRRSNDKLERIGSVTVPPYAVGLVAF